MSSKKKIAEYAVNALKKKYPDAVCSLEYKKPHELLIATRLAAQCTDKRVNVVTKELFKKYRTVNDFANADVLDVAELIKTCGLYNAKAKDIVQMCKIICDKFSGKVPDTMENLLVLPGVGRKTANLILGDVYAKPAVVVDTHCMRITKRLGLHDMNDAKKIEKLLRELLDPIESNDFCHRLVMFGREICTARKPKCDECIMNDFCEKRWSDL